jgi:hypothetical protein
MNKILFVPGKLIALKGRKQQLITLTLIPIDENGFVS